MFFFLICIAPLIIIVAAVAFCSWYYLHFTNEANRRIQNHITDGKAMLPPGAVVVITIIATLLLFFVLLLLALFVA